jgi:hypothetical protein
MRAVRKRKSQTHFALRLEATLKAKALRFQPSSVMGARGKLLTVGVIQELCGVRR